MKKNMKQFFKTALALVALTAVSFSSYKAYDSYVAANMSEEELLMQGNVLALSEDHSSLRRIAWHEVYKVIHTHECDAWSPSGKYLGEYVTISIKKGYWQTCDRVSNSDYPICANDICTSEACVTSDGWESKKTTVQTGEHILIQDNSKGAK